MKYLYLLILLLTATYSSAQVLVINEIDSDTPSTDVLEFVEIKSETPHFSLDGYVLAFLNGNTTGGTALKIYYSVDLSGLVTDANGLLLVGNVQVAPVPAFIIPNNTIQNGPDAVAIYQGDISAYQMYMPATTNGLIHAIGHGVANTPPAALLTALGITEYYSENANNQKDQHSIQRNTDGTYFIGTPTAGYPNNGTGITYNGISILVDTTDKNEGESFDITFSTQQPVIQDLSFNYSLINDHFTEEDYLADLEVFIPAGNSSVTKTVQLLNDGITEGDETLLIQFGSLPDAYIRMNDFIAINIIDANYIVSDFGTPLNPTYGNVLPTYEAAYYTSLNGKSGIELRQALQDIIADENTVRKHSYGDIVDILKTADQNPENSNEVWLMYVEAPRRKNLYQLGSVTTGFWNREHIFPQSRGGFANATSSVADGIEIWEPTNADDIAAGHSDAHHLRAEDGPTNSSRGNKDYGLDDYNGPVNNQGSWKGDVARALFYMDVRYNLLHVVEGNLPDATNYQIGDLNTLMQWHVQDPSDDFEMNRNNYIYTWQYNRNPFIDLPELADYIFGDKQDEIWQWTASTEVADKLFFKMYPNPAQSSVYIQGLKGTAIIEVYDVNGRKLTEQHFYQSTTLPLTMNTGIYLVKILSDNKTATQKLIVK